jgi:hypothetical protein
MQRHNFNNGNYEKIREELNIDWSELLEPHKDDIEKLWGYF